MSASSAKKWWLPVVVVAVVAVAWIYQNPTHVIDKNGPFGMAAGDLELLRRISDKHFQNVGSFEAFDTLEPPIWLSKPQGLDQYEDSRLRRILCERGWSYYLAPELIGKKYRHLGNARFLLVHDPSGQVSLLGIDGNGGYLIAQKEGQSK